ncbi:MAG TPA: hydrogenase maturation nickel metallochaperone HypA [Anaerolineales bacterium]
MHELAVTESILEIAQRHAEQAGAKRITGLHIAVGQLSSIVDDSVQFYWDIIAAGTLAEAAALEFRRIPIELICQVCGRRYTPAKEDFACPDCASERIKVVAGEEFYLEAIDIEK